MGRSAHKFLETDCKFSEDGHQMGFIDSWPEREYQTGKNIWRHKYFCVFCLEQVLVDSYKGRDA